MERIPNNLCFTTRISATVGHEVLMAEDTAEKKTSKIKKERKKTKASKISGEERFDLYYQKAFGERWAALKEALLQPNRHVARINAFTDVNAVSKALRAAIPATLYGPDNFGSGAYFPSFLVPEDGTEEKFPSPDFFEESHKCGIKTHYPMDLASIVAARMLDVKPGDTVCDLCAAPGGKSLILAEALQGEGKLVANDRSDGRCYRLRATLDDYLPKEIRATVLPTNHDASRWHLYESNTYDKILLDAPCSSERHIMSPGAEEYIQQWSPSRTKRLASQQKALLWSAVQALKPGGRILYSTCSLSVLENDGVVQKAIKKNKGQLEVVPQEEIATNVLHFMTKMLPGIEKTECGWIILPDRCKGWGPMFFTLLTKKGGTNMMES